ncbi:LysM peptidoglycan-binding domain-containing protein [Vibrio furnissii]|uniref:LysM peptidoglycan-binding domain-containing protein n=1 Tax=Vibrio furnissii TaxID=29494 RepID=UPI0024BA1E51|nr:LysM peptidoglycan-binding domain-containing protein [Vibrio furnissii]WHR50711.1 LysM peptidoglycan-binding domain-containing protein [Vibrio furnissii]
MRKLTRRFASILSPRLWPVWLASLSVWAQPAPLLALKKDAPTTYTVVQGDTLWDISALYLDSPWLWPRLWQINPEIHNPDLIYPGDKLTLIWRDGQPLLSLKPMVTLSPKVRVVEKQSLPAVDEGLLLPYLQNDRLVNSAALTQSLRVMGAGDGRQYLTAAEAVYIPGPQTHAHWGIYRPMAEFVRDDQAMTAMRLIATAELGESGQNTSALRVRQLRHEIRVNDIVLPETGLESLNLTTSFFPQPAPTQLQARILGALEGSQYAGQHHVVVIDKGTNDALVQGSMFALYRAGVSVYADDGQYRYEAKRGDDEVVLPAHPIGSLMVIRPYAAFSLALVTESREPIDITVLAVAPEVADLDVAASVPHAEPAS